MLTVFTVVNTANSGAGSLRQAILDANVNPGADDIFFNIPGPGIHTIAPLSGLPTITDPTDLDGTTQPGFSGSPVIEIAGGGLNTRGLELTASNSTIRGLIINGFRQQGIIVHGSGASNNVIAGNWVGVDSTGTLAVGNGLNGSLQNVLVFQAGVGNRVGGATAADRNVVSGGGSTADGIVIQQTTNAIVQGNYAGTNVSGTGAIGNTLGIFLRDASGCTVVDNLVSGNRLHGISMLNATNNMILGNYVGTQAGGTGALGNVGIGVNVSSNSNNNHIGGLSAGDGNIVCSNGGSGLGAISVTGSGNILQGNSIGVDVLGNAAGNSSNGIRITGSNNQIGGSATGASNHIAFNSAAGIRVEAGVRNSIRRNSIANNGQLGIDLLPAGVTFNDPSDLDPGPNNLQNFPVLTATASGGGTQISGTLNSTPNTTFVIEFFDNMAADPSTFGEGETFIGDATVTTDATGNASFSVLFAAVPVSHFISATATDPNGNTSEFSGSSEVVPGGNTPPVAEDDSYVLNEDGVLAANDADGNATADDANDNGVLVNDMDAEGDALTATLVSGPMHGSLVFNSDGTFTYTPAADYFGSDSFTYVANDGQADSNVATAYINVRSVNDPPVADDDSDMVAEDGSVTTNVVANDTAGPSNEDQTLTVVSVTQGANGVVTNNGNGTVTYTPNQNFFGTDSYSYTVSDSDGATATASVMISVSEVNDAPIAADDAASTSQDVSTAGNVLSNDTDPDNTDGYSGNEDDLDAVLVSGPAHGVLSLNSETGAYTYTPNTGYFGSDSFTYQAVDSDGAASNVATVSIVISAAAPGSVYVVPDSCQPGKTALIVNGTSSDDDIHIAPAGSGVEVTINGVAQGMYSPTGRIIVFGYSGNDAIQLAGSIDNEAWLYGDGGDDRLNLGNGGGIAFGGDGNDYLLGGNARDILVGGDGADRLVGNAGDDIMMAAFSIYDDRFTSAAHGAAWCAISHEWTRLDHSYQVRVNNLTDGSGSADRDNGPYFLNSGTVLEDNDADLLTGAAAQDWFFANLQGSGAYDKITDLKSNEALEELTV